MKTLDLNEYSTLQGLIDALQTLKDEGFTIIDDVTEYGDLEVLTPYEEALRSAKYNVDFCKGKLVRQIDTLSCVITGLKHPTLSHSEVRKLSCGLFKKDSPDLVRGALKLANEFEEFTSKYSEHPRRSMHIEELRIIRLYVGHLKSAQERLNELQKSSKVSQENSDK